MEFKREYRKIQKLEWAKLAKAPPKFEKPPKCKGARAKGYTYERTVGRRLKERIIAGEINAKLVSNQWFAFEDSLGAGFCQTDHYLICDGFIVLIECKLSQSSYADDQMTKLYEPVLRAVYGLPVVCVQVFKNVRAYPKNSIMDILEIIKFPKAGVHNWHFLG